MIAIYITIAFAAGAFAFFIGMMIGSAKTTDLMIENEDLRWHLYQILEESDNGQITATSRALQMARDILDEK